MASTFLIVLLLLTAFAFYCGRKRSCQVAALSCGISKLHSRPTYYGALAALWCVLPAALLYAVWHFFESSIVTHFVVAGLPESMSRLP
ncbi:MAG: phosphate ABC transporter permease family protein, partial [Deltaproteobacteria bacterium]|nr:phosphate ABC transporter permease family protein [Deltaproteobacteria bacterium]